MTVREIYDWINSLAPFETQASFDNAGLLVGHPDWEVTGVHFALDVTPGVLDEAEARGANLIVTHHPLMFAARKQMTECDYEGRLLCRMIRSRMALISAHTNLDAALGGINDVLAQQLGLTNITGEGYMRVGDLSAPMTAEALRQHVTDALDTTVRVMSTVPLQRAFHRVAVCSGAGSDEWEDALAQGADVFLTGEVKHHHALAMADAGLLCLECGHFATEQPGIFALADALQKHLDAVQYTGYVSKSRLGAYAMT